MPFDDAKSTSGDYDETIETSAGSATESPDEFDDPSPDGTEATTAVITNENFTNEVPDDPPRLPPAAARKVLQILLDAYEEQHGHPFDPRRPE
jgi:hypothetical protein